MKIVSGAPPTVNSGFTSPSSSALISRMRSRSASVRTLADRDRIREIKAEEDGEVNPLFTVGGAPLTIFMNRNQQTYTGGADNAATKRSSVVGSGSATVGAYRGTNEQWNAIMSCVQQQFAQFNVTVT